MFSSGYAIKIGYAIGYENGYAIGYGIGNSPYQFACKKMNKMYRAILHSGGRGAAPYTGILRGSGLGYKTGTSRTILD